MSFITGVGLTAYGKHEGFSSLDLMSQAAQLAISDAGLKRSHGGGLDNRSVRDRVAEGNAELDHVRPALDQRVEVGG